MSKHWRCRSRWWNKRTRIALIRLVGLIVTILMIVSLTGGCYAINERGQTRPRNAALKVMPLGDSITLGAGSEGGGGYRLRLWQRLVQQSKLNIDFVGSQQSGPPELADKNHEGHGGWRIDQVRAVIDSILAKFTPDVVLLHIGTNDLGERYQLDSAPVRLRDLADRICADRPGINLVIATIIPIVDDEPLVKEYDAKIPGVVAGLQESGCKAHYVDMNRIVSVSELSDGAHPTSSGYAKMADAWYPPIKTIYNRGAIAASSSRVEKYGYDDGNRHLSSEAKVRIVNDDVFNYKGPWRYAYDLANTYMGDVHDSANTGDTFTFVFAGSGVILYGMKGPQQGIAAISIDDTAENLVDCFTPVEQRQTAIYHSPTLSDTAHTLKVRVTGENNPASSGTVVAVDRLDLAGRG